MNLNALKQTVAPEQDPHCEEEEGRAKKRNDGKKKEKGVGERKREKRGERWRWRKEKEERAEGGGRERKVKNLHITMPEKNQNIFHRKMGHFQILVPYQTN